MRKRNVEKHFYFSEEEAYFLQQKSKMTGYNESKLIRCLLQGYQPKERPDREFYTFMNELSLIGSRVNQLAVKANSLGFIDTPMLREEVKKWHDFRLRLQIGRAHV